MMCAVIHRIFTFYQYRVRFDFHDAMCLCLPVTIFLAQFFCYLYSSLILLCQQQQSLEKILSFNTFEIDKYLTFLIREFLNSFYC